MNKLTFEFWYFFQKYNKEKINFLNINEAIDFLKFIDSNFEFNFNTNICNFLNEMYHEYLLIKNFGIKFDNELIEQINNINDDIWIINKLKLLFSKNNAKPINIDDLINVDFWTTLFDNNLTNKNVSIINYLIHNNLIKEITNKEKLNECLELNKFGYIGFDPSFKSLHLGNYVMINIINILNTYNIKTYAMVGGATGMIGDPSGKSNERNLLDKDQIIFNKNSIISQLNKFCINKEILDNYDHFKNFNYLDFLRDVGKYININYLLEKEIIKNRLETGISYTEFSYNIIQGYDFYKLYKERNISIQIGGSDQWGNITTGIELIRKLTSDKNTAVGFTINLLTNSEGKKFGKSEKGAVYLDKHITSIYHMYQFLINQSDIDSIKLILFLTNTNPIIYNFIKNISEFTWFKRHRIAQNYLTKWLISNIHSHNDYLESYNISKKLFNEEYKELSLNVLMQIFDNDAIVINNNFDSINIVDFLEKTNVFASKREIRELINSNSISINGNKINNINYNISIINDFIHKKYLFLKKGKKHFFVFKLI